MGYAILAGITVLCVLALYLLIGNGYDDNDRKKR
jgi:hypothetical protein